MSCIEILKLAIEAVITFGATFSGVYIAIQADNKREQSAKDELKKKLIVGLNREIEKLLKLITDVPSLITFQDYYIDCPIIEFGIKDQVKSLDDELIDKIMDLRSSIREMNQKFEVLRQIHIEYLGKGNFGEKAVFVSNTRGDWNTFRIVIKSRCDLALKILKNSDIAK